MIRYNPGLKRRRNPTSWRGVKHDALRVLWSEVIRTRDRFTCRKCGAQRPFVQIEAAHILSAGAHANLKHEVSNGLALCSKHHRWAHDYPEAFTEWVKSHIGIDRYTKLIVLAQTMRRPGKTEIRLALKESLRLIKEGQAE